MRFQIHVIIFALVFPLSVGSFSHADPICTRLRQARRLTVPPGPGRAFASSQKGSRHVKRRSCFTTYARDYRYEIAVAYAQESGDGIELLISGDYQNRADYFKYAKKGITRVRGEPKKSDLDSFKRYTGKWKFSEIGEQKMNKFSLEWKEFSDEKKRLLVGAYFDPFTLYNDNIIDKERFDEFNNAYTFLIEYSGSEDISLDMFGESNDEVIKEYGKKYPWIDLEFANVSDRIVIYENEKGNGFKRFDKGSLKKNARLFSQLE